MTDPGLRQRVHVLEPEEFKRALEPLRLDRVRRLALVAALAGLRWGELVALRVEDVDWTRNRIRVTRALYRRVPGAPKTEESVGEVPICPTARRILKAVSWERGYVFSVDGQTPIGDGSWIKRQWRQAQRAVGITQPVSWHDFRHLFVSLLIAAGSTRSSLPLQRVTGTRASRFESTGISSTRCRSRRPSGGMTSFGLLATPTCRRPRRRSSRRN